MRDELWLFEQTVPDLYSSLFLSVRTPGPRAAHQMDGDMSYEILNLINLYWVGFYYARSRGKRVSASPWHLSKSPWIWSIIRSVEIPEYPWLSLLHPRILYHYWWQKKWNHYSATIERTFIGLGMFYCSKLNGFIKYHILVGIDSRVYWQASLIRVVVIYY